MPRYDFTCKSCGNAEERVLTLREFDQTQRCTQVVGNPNFQGDEGPCNGEMEKGWTGTAPGVVFKGRGWTPKHYDKQPGRRR